MSKTINLSDESLFTAIWGSGASGYPWYVSTDLDEDALTYKVVLEGAQGGVEGATITPSAIRRTIDLILDVKPEYTRGVQEIDWTDEDCDSDVDADIADTIIQVYVLGEVVFG